MTDHTVRAIVVDPIERTVAVMQIEGKPSEIVCDGRITTTLEGLRSAIFDGLKREDDTIDLVLIDPKADGFVDENGILVNWDDQSFFVLTTKRGKQTLAGRMAVVGSTPEGEGVDCPLSVDEVAKMITWLDARDVVVPAPTVVFVEDGVQVVKQLCDRETFDYEHRPD